MINITDKSKCTGCHACFSICPKQCIKMVSDQEGFLYPLVNEKKCINCGFCEKVCPILHTQTIENIPIAYAAYNKDEDVRLNSSSGGIFSLLAEQVLYQNGVILGACFDENFNVVHSYTECMDELFKFRSSKYVQSNIGNTYQQTKAFLEEGRFVLFTGTPCQIGGLKAYLRKDYDNLICQDIICHGVPSPKVWQKYVDYREKRAGAPVRRITFRQKNEGWKRFSISFLFKNDIEYHQTLDKDLMMTAFLRNACLRPSCYKCSFKTIHRESDITLADFWGIQNILPEMDDDKGTSLVIINSEKGKKLFDSIKKHMIYKEIKFEEAIRFNSAMTSSVSLPSYRTAFFRDLNEYKFNQLIRKYCIDGTITKVKRKIQHILAKFK